MADLLMLGALALFVALLILDVVKPARKYAHVKWWRAKGLVFTLIALVLNAALPALFTEAVGEHALLPGARLGTLGGFVVGLVVVEFFGYWIHRVSHSVDFLWRWLHQLHHSAERFDTFGAFFFHPFDVLQNIALWTIVPGLVLGLSPEAAGILGVFGFFLAFFQHANIHTPQLLGYLVQRPEGHGVHHERGVHGFNFGNIALWDLVFGTFRNPAEAPAVAGFYEGGTRRMKDMLLGRDISGGSLGHEPDGRASLAVRV